MNRELTAPTEVMTKRSFWNDLVPHLTISDVPWSAEANKEVAREVTPVERFGETGYVSIPALLSAEITTALADGLDALTAANLPTPFLFMYDEAWKAYGQLDAEIARLMGPDYLLGGDLWAWSLEPTRGAHGWTPHRDSMYKVPDCADDGEPNYASMWISLTEVTADNGCICVVPRKDSPLGVGSADVADKGVPLLAPQGSLLGWAPDIIHWSLPVTGADVVGRKSMAVFAQRNDIGPLSWDMLRVGEPVSFDYRLGMVCRQLLRYIDSSLHPGLHGLATWRDFAAHQDKRFSRFLSLLAKVNGRHIEEAK